MRKVWKTRLLWVLMFVGVAVGGAPVLSVILLGTLAGLPRMAVVLERDGRHFVVRGGGPGVVAESDFVPIPEEQYRRRIAWETAIACASAVGLAAVAGALVFLVRRALAGRRMWVPMESRAQRAALAALTVASILLVTAASRLGGLATSLSGMAPGRIVVERQGEHYITGKGGPPARKRLVPMTADEYARYHRLDRAALAAGVVGIPMAMAALVWFIIRSIVLRNRRTEGSSR